MGNLIYIIQQNFPMTNSQNRLRISVSYIIYIYRFESNKFKTKRILISSELWKMITA